MIQIKNNRLKVKIIIILFAVLCLLNIIIYELDKIFTPIAILTADSEVRADSIQIINNVILNKYSEKSNGSLIGIEKDNMGNITMINVDTVKMNQIACDISIDVQKKLKEAGEIGIRLPLGYVLKNNISMFANTGPKVTIKMQPIGYTITKYSSEFKSAGINQSNLIIYADVDTKIRVMLPVKSDDIEVKSTVPLSETVIVGKVPNAAIQFGSEGTGNAYSK